VVFNRTPKEPPSPGNLFVLVNQTAAETINGHCVESIGFIADDKDPADPREETVTRQSKL